MLGDGIRKNIATISDEDRTLFVNAVRRLDDSAIALVSCDKMTNGSASTKFRVVARWRGSIALCLVLGCWSAHAATFTTFDVPGAIVAYPVSINPAGAITGFYADASYVSHGFLRAHDGTVNTFSAPRALV